MLAFVQCPVSDKTDSCFIITTKKMKREKKCTTHMPAHTKSTKRNKKRIKKGNKHERKIHEASEEEITFYFASHLICCLSSLSSAHYCWLWLLVCCRDQKWNRRDNSFPHPQFSNGNTNFYLYPLFLAFWFVFFPLIIVVVASFKRLQFFVSHPYANICVYIHLSLSVFYSLPFSSNFWFAFSLG